jgi:uncharacterized membrane protein (DUF373 family)
LSPVQTWLDRFERAIAVTLIGLMGTVVLLATLDLVWLIVKDVTSPPVLLLEIDELLELFGFFMLILIGLELMETIRAYLVEHVVHAEVVVEVAIIAIARKVIILDIKEYASLSLIGIAAIIVALAVAFLIIKRMTAEHMRRRTPETPHSA